MVTRLPPLTSVRTFVTAARAGSFLKAADELCVTPAAVSRSVRALEDHLGCMLFDRGHRQIKLTEDGQFYLRELGDAFERIALATQNLAARRMKRPLAVCAFPSFIIDWLIPRWSSQQLRENSFDIRFVTTHTHDVDFSGEIDVAILTDREVYHNNRCEKLFTASLVPVCSSNYLAPGTMAADVEEWTDGLLISETRPNDWARWQQANGGQWRFDPFSGRRFESSPLLYQAAIAGMGIGIGIREILVREFATGSLIEPFPEMVPAPCPFYMIWPASTDGHPDFAAFRQWIRREVGTE
ncbi:LysR family glycine cleavage system transcriptional activator [Amaricoccus macauensis]|uniref:LysR family glycine cleavage system transcriptional activator n=1 Tax=Amaricoccus macauensis TaxID=57001 RepID=A0A840SI71_9RHOB|nr:LysR substrate-binding domain-containing protein [Amaricoccus macauensis]MBB5220375.1 LysR family glycine cleavage system transcriptional activator [Amaricoccus macauensis]